MSQRNSLTEAAKLRSDLKHPVIDVDGHHLEFLPTIYEYLREGMGSRLFEVWLKRPTSQPLAERQMQRIAQPGWWTTAPATRPDDRAAAALPRLLRERMDDFGIDFMILYTSVGLGSIIEPEEELRRTFCWAINEFYADHYLSFQDRLTPAGVVPLYTPEEALSEIDHCYALGLKVVQLPHGVPRPITDIYKINPNLYPRIHWLDTFGVDSAFNYDTVWQRLIDLGFAATFHGHSSHAAAAKSSRSVTNYVYNHLGAHAGLMLDLCKSLILSGVTQRFARLPLAFLEGGVHWASGLLNDFIEHWEKRNIAAIGQYDPRRLDLVQMQQLFFEWGGEILKGRSADDLRLVYGNRREGPTGDTAEPESLDDFKACDIHATVDIAKLFTNLFFGCEADDVTVCFAYHQCNALGLKLRAMFSSDFGHWDAGQADQLLMYSYNLVKRGLISTEDFRSFAADNAIKLHGAVNPNFWKNTVVQDYAQTITGTGST